jgi:hypothetical protein
LFREQVGIIIFWKKTENSLRSNFITFYIKVDEEGENETKLIPSSNISNQPGSDSPTSTLSLPNTNKLTRKNAPPQADEKMENKKPTKSKGKKKSVPSRIGLMHCDIIKDEFWDARPGLLYM